VNRRALGFWLVLAVMLLAVGLLSGRQAQQGDPLDPDATNQQGTAALLALLEEYGAEVDRGLPNAGTGTTLILADRMGDEQHRTIDRWVQAGGTLVVTDPGSPFAPTYDFLATELAYDELAAGTCELGDGPGRPAVDDLAGLRLEANSFLLYSREPPDAGGGGGADEVDPAGDGEPEFEAPELVVSGGCFSEGGGEYLQVSPRGAGRVIALGGAGALTNQYLDEADNAVLAVELLAPGDRSGGRVTVIYEPIFSAGTRTLSDLVPSGAKWSAAGLLVAAGLYVWRRARRFGSPVPEPQPVELPASLLIRAVGELRRRSGGQAEASQVLRADLAARLRRQLKVPADLPLDTLAAQAAAVGGLDPALVSRALTGLPAVDGAALAALVVDIDTVNRAVSTDGRTGDGSSQPGQVRVPSLVPSAPSPTPVGAVGESR
jgi:hypothetical protein